MDEIEQRISNTFSPAEQNLKNMSSGLKWLWGHIYKLLNLILSPIEKGINYLIGNSESKEEDNWF